MVSARRSLLERARLSSPLKPIARTLTHWLIEWSLRRHFRAVYLRGTVPETDHTGAIVYANHHYWWDGYLCYALARACRRQPITWMLAYRRFPPFGLLGALPFPPNNPARRAQIIRQTIEWLQNEPRLFFLFPEGRLHPDANRLLPFERSLAWLARKLPAVPVVPMAITIQATYHQYPCAFMTLGDPLPNAWRQLSETEYTACATERLQQLLTQQQQQIATIETVEHAHNYGFRLLLQGKLSVHERAPGSVGFTSR